jgi:acetyl esterase
MAIGGSTGFDPSVFRPGAISRETRAANEAMSKATAGAPDWWVVGVPAVRAAAASGKGPFPRLPKSARARTMHVDGKGGRRIALHVVAPERATGVHLHLHGGGMVFGSSEAQDSLLDGIVDRTGMACVSVEYRLAPEHPYPAAWDDCESVARWLRQNAQAEFGSDRLTIGGESAGATLGTATLLRLRDRDGQTGFRAASLAYGNYDASLTPSQRLSPDRGLVSRNSLEKYIEAYLPSGVDRRNPDVSPLYAKLDGLPPALFSVGTADPLLDDTLFMHSRWIAAGNQAELAIYPGAPHAFNVLPMPLAPSANARIEQFLKHAIT